MKHNNHLNTTYEINTTECEAPVKKVQKQVWYYYTGHLQTPTNSGETGSHYTKRNYRNSLLKVPGFQCSIFKVNGQVWPLPVSAPLLDFKEVVKKLFPFPHFLTLSFDNIMCTIEF